MEEMWETEAEFLGEMLLEGAANSITHEDGELVVSWNADVLKAKYPAVYEIMLEVHMEEVNNTLNEMVENGILEREPVITPDGKLDELYSLTDEGRKIAEQMPLNLPFDTDE